MLDSLDIFLEAWLALAVVSGIPAALLLYRDPASRRLPPRRHRLVPWTGFEVLGVALACVWWMAFCSMLLNYLSPRWFNLEETEIPFWVTVLALPPQIVTAFLILRTICGARFYQLGLSRSHWSSNIAFGTCVWFVVTPIVLLLNALIVALYTSCTGKAPLPHPFGKLLEDQPSLAYWFVVFLQAVLLGPFFEELVYRGILQPWLVKRPQSSPILLAVAIMIASLGWFTDKESQTIGPLIFTLCMLPGYFLIALLGQRRLFDAAGALAIYSTSLLFAAFHSNVWPSPIPLFFLGLALGLLAYRTQSLIGPILVHGLFNAVSCLALALHLPHAEAPVKGNDVTSAGWRAPPASTSTLVPGSWLPRRR